MAKFETDTFVCLAPRPVRLYRTVYDNTDCGIVTPAKLQFISKKQYVGGQTAMYHITEGPEKLIGYWCPAKTIQTMPVMKDMREDPPAFKDMPAGAVELKGKYARIKGLHPVIYKMHDGDKTLPHGLRVGDELTVDYAITTILNGSLQFRYHVVDSTGEDQTLNNTWLLQNSSMQIMQRDSVVNKGELEEMVRPFLEEPHNGPKKIRQRTSDSYIPGENLPEINKPEYNIYDHIPDSWKSTIPEDWMDYMPDGWSVPESWNGDLLPPNWLDDIPMDWLPNIPDSWKALSIPSLPEMGTTIGTMPDNWRDYFPSSWRIPDSWKTEGVPGNWWEQIPENIRNKLPQEWKNYVFPDLEMQVAHQYWSKTVDKAYTLEGMMYLPNQHDSGEQVSEIANFIDYSQETSVHELLENQHQFYANSMPESSLTGVPIGKMLFVHGMPFQFTHITDRRNGATMAAGGAFEETQGKYSGAADVYGRTFGKEIAANMPIATIVPGKPKFMTNIQDSFMGSKILGGVADAAGWVASNVKAFFTGSKDASPKDAMVQSLISDSDDVFQTLLDTVNPDAEYNYYSLEIDTTTYFEYVNSLAHTSARLMGLAGISYCGVACTRFDWGAYNKDVSQDFSMFQEVAGMDGGVSFAYEPTGSISDTISTQTTESSIASKINGFAGMAREAEFLMGYSGIDVSKLIDTQNFTEATPASVGDAESDSMISSTLKRLQAWAYNSIHGMNIKFPEIWSDSQHTQSYEIEMHFIAPYGTSFCKWRYVLVPFFHVFALAAPRSDKNVSQYRSPFLIRAFSKGYFNVEMGIVESLNYKRYGDGSMISEDGVPLQIDASLQFKDLYHVLTMTNMYRKDDGSSGYNVENFYNNTGLIDMIGTLSGVDMNRINMGQRLQLLTEATVDVLGSKPKNFMSRISDRVRGFAERFYGM